MTDSTTVPSGHPKGLYTLFFSEMWERFCYYGMRVLLTLFLVKSLLKGDAEASLIYGAYTALIYAAPVLGGRMADKYLGYRCAIILGAVLMAIGEFLILGATEVFGGNEAFMLLGMGALISATATSKPTSPPLLVSSTKTVTRDAIQALPSSTSASTSVL